MEAPTRSDAAAALERFCDEFDAKYPKALAKLDRDWQHLTAFYDFLAEHWRQLRTSNAFESSFAAVKPRTRTASPRALGRGRSRSRWPTSSWTPPVSAGRFGHELVADVCPKASHRWHCT
jgi:hypothetical protein